MTRKKKHEEEEHENHERWLVSYADMVTLLMALFIVLFSMASVDEQKFAALASSFTGQNNPQHSVLDGNQGIVKGGTPEKLDSAANASMSPKISMPVVPNSNQGTEALRREHQKAAAAKQDSDNLEQVKQEIQASLDAHGMGDSVRFRKEPKGLVVSIVTDRVLFDSGKAAVKPQGAVVLDALGPPISHLPNQVAIEGHTDDQPINSAQFPTNWELSTTRATSVLRYLTDREGVPASRLGAAGYADQRPVVPNNSSEHRAQNRRVEVVIHALTNDSAPTIDTQNAPTAAAPTDTPEVPTLPPKPQIDLPAADKSVADK